LPTTVFVYIYLSIYNPFMCP